MFTIASDSEMIASRLIARASVEGDRSGAWTSQAATTPETC